MQKLVELTLEIRHENMLSDHVSDCAPRCDTQPAALVSDLRTLQVRWLRQTGDCYYRPNVRSQP